MQWVRIHPIIANWPGGGPPPTFNISADENGTVVVELAWDPQALLAPATYANPLRYYSSCYAFNETLTNDNGSTRTVSIPAQTIQLNGNRVTWTIPQALWDAYLEESLKTLRTPSTTTFSRNLYYRVRATASGASQAHIWPVDSALTGANAAAAPRIGILPISATPSSQVAPDQAAITAMGGVPSIAPTIWSDLLSLNWRNLPESDPDRQALVRIFAHSVFQAANLPSRAALLKLWLFAGPNARRRLPQLLDRNTITGSNMAQPIITKLDLHNGKTLVENLLALLDITPHPDLVKVTSKEELLDHVIMEMLDPNGQVNQGRAGTCGPTAIQNLLVTLNPSEYARLQTGWLSSAGRATLSNGAVTDVPASVLQVGHYRDEAGQPSLARTYSELAFQTAILKLSQGARFPALTGTPENIIEIVKQTIMGGLYANEMKTSLDALFRVNFTVHEVTFPYNSTDAGWRATQVALRNRFLTDLANRHQQVILETFWDSPYAAPPNGGAHYMMAIRREAGTSRVFFKNPQYPGSHPPLGIVQGGNGVNPPRRYEDPSQAIESFTEADLSTWIMSYLVPDTALI